MALKPVALCAVLCASLFFAANAASQSTNSDLRVEPRIQPVQQDDLSPLPLGSNRILELLPPAILRSEVSSRMTCTEWSSGIPCDCRVLAQKRYRQSHAEQLRASLHILQGDKNHSVRVYLVNHSQKKGRVISIGEDSFTIKVGKHKPDVTLSIQDVSWVTKEPNGSEKFGRGVEMTVAIILLAPFIIPIALLFAANGTD